MAVHFLPKEMAPVRFRYPAQKYDLARHRDHNFEHRILPCAVAVVFDYCFPFQKCAVWTSAHGACYRGFSRACGSGYHQFGSNSWGVYDFGEFGNVVYDWSSGLV